MKYRNNNSKRANPRAKLACSANTAASRRLKRTSLLLLAIVSVCVYGLAVADEPAPKDQTANSATIDTLNEQQFAQAYADRIKPLVKQYCADCHSPELAEADLDLTAFASVADARQHSQAFLKIAEMLDSQQMPPVDAKQPSDAERAELRAWVRRLLKEEARRYAGDPGPVVLRRLSNAEYTYLIRDLTGVASLEPAKEFPVDGAAGEGFTNAAVGLVMSPALLAKYLDAGKDVAAHAMLLPDGIEFSPGATPRDWTEQMLQGIRALYNRYTVSQQESHVTLQGIALDTNGGGRLPVERYFEATLAERDALTKGTKTTEAVARERSLSPKYLASLWKLMTAEPPTEGKPNDAALLLDPLRARWKTARPEDAVALAADVARWQQALWRFTSVGHIGKVGGPKSWAEAVSPLTARQDFKFKIPPAADGKEVVFYLAASDAGDGNEHDYVVWERPRLVAPGRPDLPLRDLRGVIAELTKHRQEVFDTTAKCLAAAAEANLSKTPVEVPKLAEKHGVNAQALEAWLDFLGISASGPVKLGPALTQKAKTLSGYEFISAWVGNDALSLVANSSDQHVRIPGNMAPHSVAVHPAPTQQIGAAWRSPIAGSLTIEGVAQHAHPECGNGVEWTVEVRRGSTRQRLAAGIAHGGAPVPFGPIKNVAVRPGDVVVMRVGPREANHSCDLTLIDLALDDGEHKWRLSSDVSPNLLAGNPHADASGRPDIWTFFSEPNGADAGPVLPANSLLARWQVTESAEEKAKLAGEIQSLLQNGPGERPKDSPDVALYHQMSSLSGPLFSAALRAQAAKAVDPNEKPAAAASNQPAWGIDPQLFGKHPSGAAVDPASLCVQAPAVIEVRLPGELVQGADLVTTGYLHPANGAEGSAQLRVATEKPENTGGLLPSVKTETQVAGAWTSDNRRLSHATPILVNEGSAARRRFEAAFAEHRHWFPAGMCYTKIVPVDEVVTLTLFYREDDALSRLMLDDAEAAQLNRLWDNLHYVSRDALTLVDAFEQLMQFATQDADPSVFAPMRGPINARADAFRKLLVDTEPRHVDAAIAWAAKAYRHPLSPAEEKNLRDLYRALRDEEIPHDEAIRLLLARVMVSPAFLYRSEKTGPFVASAESALAAGSLARANKISDAELATRLSFFLWSTAPDKELLDVAASGKLSDPQVLIAQTRRMLKDERVRRMAIEFGCQWIHIYEFADHDEKSEATFPTFNVLRGAMYEESIRFLTDLFQRDGSILEVLDADHTFLNASLAEHYGIPGVDGKDWRRVDGMKAHGRGGILGMATTLSKQSGASRTSPILRGNWVCEVLLGEKLPKPPKNVPVLPETVPQGLTERQLIEQHSSVAACAKCHVRMDPFGFALEGFDAIGRTRPRGEGHPPVNTLAKLVGGREIDGLAGLRDYLLNTRRDDFVRQFCKKLLGYSLGRGLQLSDEPLVEEMQANLKANGYRFNVAVETIVQSPQFRMIRAMEDEVTQATLPTEKGSEP